MHYSKFPKTIFSRHDLKTHVENNAEDWTPKDETFEAVLDSMEADTYYEVNRDFWTF